MVRRVTRPPITNQPHNSAPKTNRTKTVSSLILLIAGIIAGLSAWVLVPPNRMIPDPSSAATGHVWTKSPVAELHVGIEHLGSDLWAMRVDAIGEPGFGSGQVSLEIQDTTLAPCTELNRSANGQFLFKDCEASHFVGTGDSIHAVTDWKRIDPETHTYSATFVAAIEASSDRLGIVSFDGGLKSAMPSINVYDEDGSQGRPTEQTFTLWQTAGTMLQWSGLMPQAVMTDHVVWGYAHTNFRPSLIISAGADAAVAAMDQRALFLAGALAGVAGGVLVAAVERFLPSTAQPAE